MAILGLMSTESVSSYRWTNIRRRVFYEYPNGAAPLIGLLSMMKEEEVNDPEFSWWEKRHKEQRTVLMYEKAGTNTICFYKAAGTLVGDTVPTPALTLADGNITWTANASYAITVVDATLFRPGHIIQFQNYNAAGTAKITVRGRVTFVLTSAAAIIAAGGTAGALATGCIGFRCLETTAANNYDDTNNPGLEVKVIGSAFPQGVTDLSSEVYYAPINPSNYTQIFRTPFSFTGNALVTPVKFDDTGIYKDKAKQHSIDHMVEMEMATLFGRKTKYLPTGTTSATTGVGLPNYTFGGILNFLELWEDGSTYNDTAYTADTDDGKRIIANSGGTLNEKTYDTYLERIFRTTSNVSNEKLVLCGSGFLKVINQMYRSLGVLNLTVPSQDTFGMELVAHKTAFGTVYYKTHPLFSQNATLRNNALFCEIHNLRYRPMSKRDTQLLKNRQQNDADYRKDEWFTEFGLEVRFPESFMYLQNVTDYTP